jgi:8-oxo-dGTP diphosphatase
MRKSVRAIVVKDNTLLVMQRDKFGQKFCALVGGGIDYGETPEQALYREVREETGLTITNPRLVIIEDAGNFYGMQYIYLCEYVSGEPALSPESEEAKISALGKNIYQPAWLPLNTVPTADLLPTELKTMLLDFLEHGFPAEPAELKINL